MSTQEIKKGHGKRQKSFRLTGLILMYRVPYEHAPLLETYNNIYRFAG